MKLNHVAYYKDDFIAIFDIKFSDRWIVFLVFIIALLRIVAIANDTTDYFLDLRITACHCAENGYNKNKSRNQSGCLFHFCLPFKCTFFHDNIIQHIFLFCNSILQNLHLKIETAAPLSFEPYLPCSFTF